MIIQLHHCFPTPLNQTECSEIEVDIDVFSFVYVAEFSTEPMFFDLDSWQRWAKPIALPDPLYLEPTRLLDHLVRGLC